jgi:hypothetical protein
VRWWRWKNRRRQALRRMALSIRNGVRRLFRQPPLSSPPLHRKFPLRKYLAFYVEAPIAGDILHEWQRFLQHAATQLDQLHRRTEEIKNDFLFMGDDAASCLQPDPEKAAAKLQKLNDHLQAVRAFSNELDRHEAEATARLEKSWANLEQPFQRDWEFAGTAMLPEKKYGEMRLAQRRREIEGQFIASPNAWRRHLQAEQEEWQQDLELSRLQLQTAKACIDILQLVRQKTGEQIIPIFQDAIAALSVSLQKFKEISPKNEAALLDAIVTEEKALRRTLQQDKLPAMIEAMAKAQLDDTLAKYLATTERAIEPLAEHHLIFKHRDLQSLPPKSKTDEIPLKDLVRNEILPELARKHRLFSDEIRQDLELISRTIAEIDQVVEFNLEAAASLLKQREEEDRIAKAHNIAVEGLERAANQVTELIRQLEKIADRSREALTQNTFAFVNRIQDLLDSEKLLALKLRVARARAQERIRQNFRKIWQVIKNALPLIWAFLVASFRRIQSQYQRLRKVAGLAPAAVGIEEKIVQFLTETQRQIAALPFVYQRLFRIEPLTDERFFAGRQGELEIIQKDFVAWQNGQFALLALVGERGSGRTTFLNFAEKEIYRQIPPLKIDITKTTYSAEGLLKYLEEVFGEKKAASLDELENRLLVQSEKKSAWSKTFRTCFCARWMALRRSSAFCSSSPAHISKFIGWSLARCIVGDTWTKS